MPDGILVNSVSHGFRTQLLNDSINFPASILAEELRFGVLSRSFPSEYAELLGPINLAQLLWMIAEQPRGEPGPLITSGWWNNARIREVPGIVATVRFKRAGEGKASHFTRDSSPPKPGWIFETVPEEDPTANQQGRLMLFTGELP